MTFVETLTVVFVVSAAALFFSDLLGQPSVPIFVVSGLVLSPFLEMEGITDLAILGAGFLVFSFGSRMDVSRVLDGKESWGAASAQILVSGSIGAGVALWTGLGIMEASLIGAAASISSSAVGMNLIKEQNSIGLLFSQESESIQFVQDIVAVIFLALASVYLSGQPSNAILALIVVFTGALSARPVFRRLASEVADSREVLMMISLGFLSVFVTATSLLGVSPVAGALAGGFAVSAYPHNIEVFEVLSSLRDFFSAVFFVSLGLLVDLSSGGWFLGLTVLFLTVFLGPAVAASVLHWRLDLRTSLLSAVSIDQVSEIVMAGAIQLHLTGLVSSEVFNAVVLGGAACFVVSSYTTRYRDSIYRAVENLHSVNEYTAVDLEEHVIVVGYDQQSKKLVKELDLDILVIENNPERASDAEDTGAEVLNANALEETTWKRANAEKAKLIVSTVPSRPVSEYLLRLDYEAELIPRASNPREASQYLQRGAYTVNFPEAVASEELLEHVEGALHSREYLERLRRKDLSELRRFLRE